MTANRIIKFRIWDGKKFGYWTPNTGFGEVAGWPKIEGEVQQFTGLTDKNGKEIYEGDIFRTENNYVGKVEWDRGGFVAIVEEGKYRRDEPLGLYTETLEVIGNIYEHSHLLNGEQQKSTN